MISSSATGHGIPLRTLCLPESCLASLDGSLGSSQGYCRHFTLTFIAAARVAFRLKRLAAPITSPMGTMRSTFRSDAACASHAIGRSCSASTSRERR